MRVMVLNPNCSSEVTEDISGALATLSPGFEVRRCADGPETIRTDADAVTGGTAFAHFVTSPETAGADGYIIACFSDPGLDLARAKVSAPVVGAQEAALLEATRRADRFGIIALSERAIPRHMRRIEALGLMDKLVAERPLLDVSAADSGRDPEAYRSILVLGEELRDSGAGALVLGCAGMTPLTERLEADIGIPVVDPIMAAGRMMLACLAK